MVEGVEYFALHNHTISYSIESGHRFTWGLFSSLFSGSCLRGFLYERTYFLNY